MEAVLDPELEICDTCIHLWDQSRPTHAGRTVNMPKYDLGDAIRDATSGHRITSMIFAEAGWRWYSDGPEELRTVGETAWVASLKPPPGKPQFLEGIVGYADLELGDRVEPVLDAQIDAGGGMFKGIRYVTSYDPGLPTIHKKVPPGHLLNPKVIEGARRVAKRGLTVETYAFYHQLGEVAHLADQIPEAKMSIHHLGGLVGIGPYSGRWDEVVAAWKTELAKIAKRPNVTMRLGGIGQPFFGMPWETRQTPPTSEEVASALRPVLSFAIDCLGPDRCMMESNYPADVIIPYNTLWNAYKRMTSEFSPAERKLVFSGTAEAFYGLLG